MIERQTVTGYRVCCDVCRRPAATAWQGSAADAEAWASGADDFERFDRPILWRGRRVQHICRRCWARWDAERWELLARQWEREQDAAKNEACRTASR